MSYPTNTTPPQFDPQMYQQYQHQQDEDHLRLLSLFHYILGGLTIAGSCFFLIHLFLGIAMLTNPGSLQSGAHSDPVGDKIGGWLFTCIGGVAVVSGWTIGGLTAYVGKCLKERRASTFIMVMSAINCLHMPIGTALGVFTIVVLSRPTVKALFDPRVAAFAGGMPSPTGEPGQPWYRG